MSSEQREALLDLIKAHNHYQITPEIRRHLQLTESRNEESEANIPDMLCGRAALLVSRFGPSASVIDVSDTCSGGLNYIQARGRRRTMVKPPWMPDKYVKIRDALPKEDREYLERELQLEVPQRKLVTSRSNPSKDKNLQAEVHESPVSYSFDYSKRIGLVGRKIGMAPQW
ncbi:bystin domain-containing protein [Ditylenchus destructor]|nr:bystin domain-containing protein [Ditylenchus destructor]